MTRWAGLLLGVWFAGTGAVAAATFALHEGAIEVAPAELGPATGRVEVEHALAGTCRCSGRVIEALVERGPRPDAHEVVYLVGPDPDRRGPALRDAGFEVVDLDEAALRARTGVEASPTLTVRDAEGRVTYRGAYAERPQMDPFDVARIADAQAGRVTPGVPLQGCAVSRAMKEKTDPLHLKYAGGY